MMLLTAMRTRLGWSQNGLAREALLHPNTVSRIESGREVPYQSQLERIAAALGFEGDIGELLREERTK